MLQLAYLTASISTVILFEFISIRTLIAHLYYQYYDVLCLELCHYCADN